MGWVAHLEHTYASNMPRTPQPLGGRIVPVSVQHGSHIFVTRDEAARLAAANSRLEWGWPLVMLGVGIAGADFLWARRKRSSTKAAG